MISVSLANESQLSTQFSEASEQLLGELRLSAALAKTDPVEATHQTRKLLKRFRSTVKLLRFCGSEELYNSVNTQFRDWGRGFSDLRDVHVRDLLLTEFSEAQDFSNHDKILAALTKINHSLLKKAENQYLVKKNIFQQLIKEIDEVDVIHQFFDKTEPRYGCIQSGLEKSFQDSYQAFLTATEGVDPELYHEWRKRSKDIQYQFELLVDESTFEKSETFQKLVQLCDLLGREHDLFMLMEWIETNQPIKLPASSLKSFYKILQGKQEIHQCIVEQTGTEFYNSVPNDFLSSVILELQHG